MKRSRIIIIVNLALLTLGAYWGVGIFYRIAGAQAIPSDDISIAASDATPEKNDETHAPSYYRPILERDLFDTIKAPQPLPAKEDLNVDELEATELKLKLWGTVAGDEDQAYAVIEDMQKREQNLYQIGDSVQNAVLKKIMRTKVVLTVEGEDQVLAMEDLLQGASTPSRSSGSPTSRFSSTAGAATTAGRSQRVSLRREMIDNAMQDISKLMTEIVIRPHMEDGQSAGLAISNIKPNSIFRRMGLRNGDVLKGVNGKEIQSVDDALQLYESLKGSDNVQVQLSRRGQDRIIDYNIR